MAVGDLAFYYTLYLWLPPLPSSHISGPYLNDIQPLLVVLWRFLTIHKHYVEVFTWVSNYIELHRKLKYFIRVISALYTHFQLILCVGGENILKLIQVVIVSENSKNWNFSNFSCSKWVILVHCPFNVWQMKVFKNLSSIYFKIHLT